MISDLPKVIFLEDPEWRPDHGGLDVEFDFDPLHYGVGGEKRREFKQRVQDVLRDAAFLLTGEVAVTWRLFVDQQKRLETAEGADVDNFAKLLNDSIKGPNGLLIDDSQIQHLAVSWLPAYGSASFDLRIQCQVDMWLTKQIALFEMSDGLWYPVSLFVRSLDDAFAEMLHHVDYSIRLWRRIRHKLHQAGIGRGTAYHETLYFAPIVQGFHRTRVAEEEFEQVRYRDWSVEYSRTPRAVEQFEELESKAQVLAESVIVGLRARQRTRDQSV